MRKFVYIVSTLLLFSCGQENIDENAEEEGINTSLKSFQTEVQVSTLKKQNFAHEIISNGIVSAREYVDLYFYSSDPVSSINVHNGDYVRKGQIIAKLDSHRLEDELEKAKRAKEKVILDFQEILIGQGYDPSKMNQIPDEMVHLAKLKSGLNDIELSLKLAEEDLSKTTLVAPFDGVVANLFSKSLNPAKTSEAFCRIIKNESMDVDFTILESELQLIKVGDEVEVSPYSQSGVSYSGAISEINPIIDENGLIKVKARIRGNKLIDGMKTRINVKRNMPNRFVVPKTAVLSRNGRQIVFTLRNGVAMWNYVQTEMENMTEFSLSNIGDMAEGDTVIISGNINLAHESPVTVVE